MGGKLAAMRITIKAWPYFYEHGRYVSPRQLRERYGTANTSCRHDPQEHSKKQG